MANLYVSNPLMGNRGQRRALARKRRRANPRKGAARQVPMAFSAPKAKKTRSRRRRAGKSTTARVARRAAKPLKMKMSKRAKAKARKALIARYHPSRMMVRAGRKGNRRLHKVRGHSIRNFAGRGRTVRVRSHLRNPLVISNPMGGIPIVGTAVSMVGPALFGALGVEAIGQVVKLVSESEVVAEYTPAVIQEYAPRFAYTLGGLVLAGVVQMITPIPAPMRHSLGLAMASAGGAVDWYRYRSESGAYGDLALGDGGDWRVESEDDYGALEFGDLAYGDLALGDFAGDADAAPRDFSVEEGEAAYAGFGAYMKKYPHRKGQQRRGVEGRRWHWLAKRAGPHDFQRLAKLPPDERVATIAAFKAEGGEEVADVPRLTSTSPVAPVNTVTDRAVEFEGAGAAY